MTDANSAETKLLSDSFSFSHPMLLFARAGFYEDLLTRTGWRMWGRHRLATRLAETGNAEKKGQWRSISPR